MDWKNKLSNIINKVKFQLHAKKIDDLESLYAFINVRKSGEVGSRKRMRRRGRRGERKKRWREGGRVGNEGGEGEVEEERKREERDKRVEG